MRLSKCAASRLVSSRRGTAWHGAGAESVRGKHVYGTMRAPGLAPCAGPAYGLEAWERTCEEKSVVISCFGF